MASRKTSTQDPDPKDQLEAFIAKFTPEVAAQAKAILAKMRKRLRGATELVYDNYNALAIGFAPNERTSDVLFSIAVYPRWVSLFLFNATRLRDPEGLLKGSGSVVRHIVLDPPELLDSPAVQRLMQQVLDEADPPLDAAARRRLIIKSISPNQRPRRPAEKVKRPKSK